MLKKILSVIMFCCMMILPMAAVTFAEGETNLDDVRQWLEPAAGEWYSTQGTLAMTIEDTTINGNQVTGSKDCTYDYPRTGTFQIAESTGNRDMKLELFGNNVHQYLVVDDKQFLRRSIYPSYGEAVNGIYLGMTKADLVQHYNPAYTTATEQGMECRTYDADKMAVILKNDVVVAIRLYKGSPLHFDKSGLTAADTPETYAQTYELGETPVVPAEAGIFSQAYKIGNGEFLFFGSNCVQLSVFRR